MLSNLPRASITQKYTLWRLPFVNWYLLGCSASKSSTTEALAVPFRVLGRKKSNRRVGTSNLSHAHKTGPWYLSGLLFKISDKQPPFILYGSPPPVGLQYQEDGGARRTFQVLKSVFDISRGVLPRKVQSESFCGFFQQMGCFRIGNSLRGPFHNFRRASRFLF